MRIICDRARATGRGRGLPERASADGPCAGGGGLSAKHGDWALLTASVVDVDGKSPPASSDAVKCRVCPIPAVEAVASDSTGPAVEPAQMEASGKSVSSSVSELRLR